ncbi:hypothetical protein [Undibacterium sp. Tian12W]|uniref:hypothetical protein n=1 Tax=Undibacterium sp. Tian12W TaxID=3413054 RepID=UPI003BF0C65E
MHAYTKEKFKSNAPVLCFLAYAFSGMACMMRLDDMNEDWPLAFSYAAIAVLVVMAICGTYWRKHLAEFMHYGLLKTGFLMLLVFSFLTLQGAPYVFLVNALSADKTTFLLEGTIIYKQAYHGKFPSRILTIRGENNPEPIALKVTQGEYDKATVGEHYQRCMRMGGLGLLFKWRNGEAPQCTDQYQHDKKGI